MALLLAAIPAEGSPLLLVGGGASSASPSQQRGGKQTQCSKGLHWNCQQSTEGALPVQPSPSLDTVQGAEQGRGTAAPREMQLSFAPVRDCARVRLEPGLCCKASPVCGIQRQSCAGTSLQPRAKGKGGWRHSPAQPRSAVSTGTGTAALRPHQHSLPPGFQKRNSQETAHTIGTWQRL